MKKRVAIYAGPLEAMGVRDGFSQLGWETQLYHYSFDKGATQFLKRVAGRVGIMDRWLAAQFNSILRSTLPRVINRFKPDFILVLKGQRLTSRNRETLVRSGVPIIFWSADSMDRVASQRDVADIAHVKFYIDGGDVDDDRSFWLPLGFSPNHCPPPDVILKKTLDIAYVGAIYGASYRSRFNRLLQLGASDLHTRYSIKSVCRVHKNQTEWVQQQLPFQNSKKLPYLEYRNFIKTARIAVNVHQDDGIKPINPMMFSIPSLRTCLAAEDRTYFHQWFEPGIDYIPFTPETFIEVLDQLAGDPEKVKSVTEQGRRHAMQAHTFMHRAETIVDHVKRYV